jgi:hypothetical protein
MVYNFICTLKGIDFKYKIEADSLEDAKIRVRNHIKNAVEIEEYIQEPINQKSNDFVEFFNDMIKPK